MLHRIARTAEDIRRAGARAGAAAPEGDYAGVIVKKPWGYEYLVFENASVAIWLLHIARTRCTSMHCHPRKTTGLAVLSGQATIASLGGERHLLVGDAAIIESGAFHSTTAASPLAMVPVSENGIWVLEIESPPLKTDLVRLADDYGRAGAGYEGARHLVSTRRSRLVLEEPSGAGVCRRRFMNLDFTVRRGPWDGAERLSGGALVSFIGGTPPEGSRIGELEYVRDVKDRLPRLDQETLCLVMEKSVNIMKLSDYVAAFVAGLGVDTVFAVSGGGAMHLVDSFGTNPDIAYVAVHHEQAAAMAAEGYARRRAGVPGLALVTSGPGGTNAITGVCGAWIDSIPTIFLSGQVTTNTLLEGTGLRQFGIQESDIVSLVRPVTKYAVTVRDPDSIRFHLEKAAHLALSGRPGPVWLDIPLDVQSAMVSTAAMAGYDPEADAAPGPALTAGPALLADVARCLELLARAERPVLICGYGIRLAHGEALFTRLVRRLGIPVVSSWTGSDLIETDHELYVGRSGIMGDRAGNFAVQNADLLLVIGSRLSIPQVGYNFGLFARAAKKIMVDVDPRELDKPSLSLDLPILADAAAFMECLLAALDRADVPPERTAWQDLCRGWKQRYPVALPEYADNQDKVNSFYFVDRLSRSLGPEATVVTDMGTSFTCTMQTFRTKAGQRLFTSSGHASMGFGLPGAVGACFGAGTRRTICISGDGGLMMNLQELQTLATYNLPLTLFILNNQGYLTIKLMQQNHFGRYVGSDPGSGVRCPDFVALAKAFGLPALRIGSQRELDARLDDVLAMDGPVVCEILMPEEQPLIPRVSSTKLPDGTIVSKPLEDLYPFLDRDEFEANMLVPPVEILKK